MRSRVFGRKVGTSDMPTLTHPGPDADGIQRIMPKALWDGDSGDLLRKVGMSPDDPRNHLPTRDLLQARHDAKVAILNKFVKEMNRTAPSQVKVVPYSMLPWALWEGKFAAFLMINLEMYPAQPWNTMLLADSERDARLMELPVHPQSYPPGLLEGALDALSVMQKEFDSAARSTGAALAQPGGTSTLSQFADVTDRLTQDVMKMAHEFAIVTFGREVYDRHTRMFGRQLGWNSVVLPSAIQAHSAK
jgi:hypothetical protein